MKDSLPVGWASWPTIVSVAQTLGMSQVEARKMLSQAGIAPIKIEKDKTTRYDPKAIDELAQSLAEDDAVNETAKRTTVRQEYGEILKLQTDYIKTLQGHISVLTTAIPNMLERATNLLIAAGERDASQVTRLYEMRENMHTAREAALTEAAEREAISQQVKASEARKAEAFGLLMKTLPRLMTQVETTIASKMGNKALKDIAELLTSIDDAQLALLLDEQMAFLNAEQREKFRAVIGAERLAKIDDMVKKGKAEQ